MDINAAVTTNAKQSLRSGLVMSQLSAISSNCLSSWSGLGCCAANGLVIQLSVLNGLGMLKRIQRIAGAHFSSIGSGYFGVREIAAILVSDRPYSPSTQGQLGNPTEGTAKTQDYLGFHNLEDEPLNIFLRSGECLRARPI